MTRLQRQYTGPRVGSTALSATKSDIYTEIAEWTVSWDRDILAKVEGLTGISKYGLKNKCVTPRV